MEDTMYDYTFYWSDGKREQLSGPYPASAACNSQFPGRGSRYIWENGTEFKHKWNEESQKWDRENPIMIKDDRRFKSRDFIAHTIGSIVGTGRFKFVASATISTDTHNYHVTLCYPARTTAMIFKLRGCAFVVTLEYREIVYPDTNAYHESWSMRIDAKVKEEWDFLSTVAEYGTHLPTFDNAHAAGWSMRCGESRTWNIECSEGTLVKHLVAEMMQIVSQVSPYIFRGCITERMSSLSPGAFEDCKDAFWAQIDLANFDKSIYGGEKREHSKSFHSPYSIR
jgi:hypothetical protein